VTQLENLFSTGTWQIYIVRKLKKPLLYLLVKACDVLPEPTEENTRRRNTHRLINLYHEFFRHHRSEWPREKMFRGLWKIAIIIYDFDNYYGDRVDKVLEWWLQCGWEFRVGKNPGRDWEA